jgi:hypothetical protein
MTGLAERVMGTAEVTWPLAVVLSPWIPPDPARRAQAPAMPDLHKADPFGPPQTNPPCMACRISTAKEPSVPGACRLRVQPKQQHTDMNCAHIIWLRASEELLDEFPELPEDGPDWTAAESTQLTLAGGAYLRGVRHLLNDDIDGFRSYGGLERVQASSGEILWVCPEHKARLCHYASPQAWPSPCRPRVGGSGSASPPRRPCPGPHGHSRLRDIEHQS